MTPTEEKLRVVEELLADLRLDVSARIAWLEDWRDELAEQAERERSGVA